MSLTIGFQSVLVVAYAVHDLILNNECLCVASAQFGPGTDFQF